MSLKKQATSGLVWTFAQQFGNHFIGFLVSLVLARLLLPEEFGLIGMIGVFVGIGNTLVNAGLTQSLIRGKQLDQEDYSTVFFSNLFSSLFIYFLIYLLAPYIAQFYNQPILTDIVRLYCITFIITAFSAVQLARLTKNMNFKTQTIVAIPATIIGGAVGVTMAYLNYGVWSLVWSHLITASVASVQLWFYSGWRPSLIFSLVKFKEHFNFGYKITLSSLIEKFFNNLFLIVIGRYFSAAQVGFYTRAETMKNLPAANLYMALDKVTYPMFSTIQDDNVRLKRVYKQLMQMVVYIIAPVMIFLGFFAEPTFRFLFTEKWLPAVPYFQILCGIGILYPVLGFNINILKVKGRSDLILKIVSIQKILIIPGLVIGFQFGIFGLLYAQLVISILTFFINAHFTNKFISYNAFEQIKDILPIILLGFITGLLSYTVDFFLIETLDIFRILLGILVCGSSYVILSILFKFRSFNDLKQIILRDQSRKK